MPRRRAGACLGLVLALAACTEPALPVLDDGNLAALRLAEACRLDEALAAADAAIADAEPTSLGYRVALHDKAVLLRDREADRDATALEAVIADLDGRSPAAVEVETLRDVAALRQRRAAGLGRPGC